MWEEGAAITGGKGLWGRRGTNTQDAERTWGTGRCGGAVELCRCSLGWGVHWGLQRCRGDLWVQCGVQEGVAGCREWK